MKTIKNIKAIFLIFGLTLFVACGGRSSSNSEDESSEYYNYESSYDEEEDEANNEKESGYKDGTYSAEIEYYNPETGTSSTYTLDVEIEDNELTVIHWPNGGWLDDSHFTPPNISSGNASFTSDEGYEYEVSILD